MASLKYKRFKNQQRTWASADDDAVETSSTKETFVWYYLLRIAIIKNYFMWWKQRF